MDEAAALAHGHRAFRRRRLVAWGFSLLMIAPPVAAALGLVDLLAAVVTFGIVVIGYFLPVVSATDTIVLRTDRDPETVREMIVRTGFPAAVESRALADEADVEHHDDGVTYEVTTLAGLVTRTLRYRFETGPQNDLLFHRSRNDSDIATGRIRIDPVDEGSRVIVEGDRCGRVNLRTLLYAVAASGPRTAALEAYGYEIVESELQAGPLSI